MNKIFRRFLKSFAKGDEEKELDAETIAKLKITHPGIVIDEN